MRYGIRLLAILGFGVALLNASPASAQRVALVVGNSTYAHLAPLNNPHLDARGLAELLKSHGWEVVEGFNLSFVQLSDALAEFEGKANGAHVALIYYAGHGMSHQNRDFVAPTDMPEYCASDVLKRVIPLDRLFQAVEGAQRKIVLLDACRNQAFPNCAKRGSEGGFRGLARVQSSGLLIASATAPGALSDDGAPGRHSPFARVLLDHFRANPSVYLHELLFKVAADVHLATRKSQTPELVVRGIVPEVCLSKDGCGPFASVPQDVAKMRKETEAARLRALKEAEDLRQRLKEEAEKAERQRRQAEDEVGRIRVEAAAAERRRRDEEAKAEAIRREAEAIRLPSSEAMQTVRSFYEALRNADGHRASSLVVPEKRARKAYDPVEMTKYWGSLAERLRVTDLRSLGNDQFAVSYAYRNAGNKRCSGSVTVTVARRDGFALIENIKNHGPSGLDSCI